jgi:alpha-L-fucosidase 2
MQFRSRALALLAALLLFSAACGRKPATIDISPKKVTIYGLERGQRLTARVLDKKGRPMEGRSPSWTSSPSAVAQVDAGGRVVAKQAGKATVTAQMEGVSAQIPVEVVDVSAIEFGGPSFALIGPAGTSLPLAWRVLDSKQAKVDIQPAWSSTDPKVASVSDAGVVTSVGPGTTNIVARVGDVQGACEVRVGLQTISRLELRPATALVRIGDSQRFVVTAYGADNQPIPEVSAAFRSSDPSVATVEPSGVATGHKAGAVTIHVELAGAKAEASLLVN